MPTIEISESADWKLFEDVAQMLVQELGGCWTEKLDGLDQRYWDLLVDEQTLTLHLEHYLGISVIVPDSTGETAQRVRALFKSDQLDPQGKPIPTAITTALEGASGEHISMELFHFYSGSTWVGWSSLEDGDPPMGVVSGEFKPASGYAVIQAECQSRRGDQSSLDLSVRTAMGMTIPCTGINISDYFQELADGCIEVSILGIPYPLYETLFPDLVEQYEQQFDQ